MINSLQEHKSENIFLNQSGIQNQIIDVNPCSKGCETLRDQLQLSEIIDKEGVILKPEELSDLIKLDESQEKILELFLDCPIIFPYEKNSKPFPLRNLLEHLYKIHENIIQSICIKGGFVRRLLLSRPFLSSMLERMSLDKEKINSLLENESFQSSEGPLADIDIVFQLHERTDPKALTQTVGESIETGILKFAFILDSFSHYSIASFGKLNISSLCKQSKSFSNTHSHSKSEYTNVEILAVRKCKDFLFPIDAVFIHITGAIRGQKEDRFSLKSFYQTGHQSIFDLFHKIIRIKDPKTINETGFLSLLSYFTKGFTAIGDKECLLQTFLNGNSPQKKLLNYFKNHHENRPDFWIAMLFHLRQMSSTDTVFQSILEDVDKEKNKLSKPFFEIYHFLCLKNFSAETLNAALTLIALFASSSAWLKSQEEKQYIQFKPSVDGPTLLLPFFPIESFQLFIDLCKKDQTEIIQMTSVFFESILFKNESINHDSLVFSESFKLIQMLKEQMKTSEGPIFYFSYLLFLSLFPIHQEKDTLFQYLPDTVKQIPPSWKKSLIQHLSYCIPEGPYKKFLLQIDEEMLKNSELFSKNWIFLLLKSKDSTLLSLIPSKIGFEKDLSPDMAHSLLKTVPWIFSKEQEEKILLRIFLEIPLLSSTSLREVFTFTLNFLHKVKITQKKCSQEFKNAYLELIKTAFKQQEFEWGKILLEHGSRLKLTPYANQNDNNLKSFLEISETLLKNEEKQKVLDPFLLRLAFKKPENEEYHKVACWIEKRIRSLAKEKKTSKIGIMLLNLSSLKISEKKWFDYALSFYENACDTQENQIAFSLFQNLIEKGFSTFKNEIIIQKTGLILKQRYTNDRESCFEFIQKLLPQKISIVVSIFPSISPLLNKKQLEKILALIFQAIPYLPSTQSLRPIFSLTKEFLDLFQESKSIFTQEFKEGYSFLIEKAFKENEILWGKKLIIFGKALKIGPLSEKNPDSLIRICTILFENKSTQHEIDDFLIHLNEYECQLEEYNSTITQWVKTRLEERKNIHKLSEIDVKFLKTSKKWLSEKEIYEYSLLFYEKFYALQEYLFAVNMLKILLKTPLLDSNHEKFKKTTNLLFNDLLNEIHTNKQKTTNKKFNSSNIPFLVECLFQNVNNFTIFTFLSKHRMTILEIAKNSLNLCSEIKSKITEHILSLEPCENPANELMLLENISNFDLIKSENFFNSVGRLCNSLLGNNFQKDRCEKTLSLLYNPRESEIKYWTKTYREILSKINTISKLNMFWKLFNHASRENVKSKIDAAEITECKLLTITLSRKLKEFPQIILKQVARELESEQIDIHTNSFNFRHELEAYLLESNIFEYFEYALSSMEKQQKPNSKNILLLLNPKIKSENFWKRVDLIIENLIETRFFYENLYSFIQKITNLSYEPILEKSIKVLIFFLNETKKTNPSSSQKKFMILSIERLMEKLPSSTCASLIQYPGIENFISKNIYLKHCAPVLIEVYMKEYERSGNIYTCFINFLNLYKNTEINQEFHEKWSKAFTVCLVKTGLKDLNNWYICVQKIQETQKIVSEKTNIWGRDLFIRNLLTEILKTKYALKKIELNSNVRTFIGLNFPFRNQTSPQEKKEYAKLIEQFLFWKPVCISEFIPKHPSYKDTIAKLYINALEKEYFKENPEIEAYCCWFLNIPKKHSKQTANYFLHYVTKITRKKCGTSFAHCLDILEGNTLLEIQGDIITSIYEILSDIAFSYPLIYIFTTPLFFKFMRHMNNSGIQYLLDSFSPTHEKLYPFVTSLIEKGLSLYKKITLSEEPIDESTEIVFALICLTQSFKEVFIQEQEDFSNKLDELLSHFYICIPKKLKTLKMTNNQSSIPEIGEDIEQILHELEQPFSNETETLKNKRQNRCETFENFWNNIKENKDGSY